MTRAILQTCTLAFFLDGEYAGLDDLGHAKRWLETFTMRAQLLAGNHRFAFLLARMERKFIIQDAEASLGTDAATCLATSPPKSRRLSS